MALTARQRQQLAEIEAGLQREAPGLARNLAHLSRPVTPGLVVEQLAPLAVNLLGMAMLAAGAAARLMPLAVTGLFIGMAGPVVVILLVRVVRRFWARNRDGRRAVLGGWHHRRAVP